MDSTENVKFAKDLVATKIHGLTTINNSFPFQTTPSGNLKVKPKQVVFETEKFSVVVADPCKTNVSVEGFMASENQKIVEFCSHKPTNRIIEKPKMIADSPEPPNKTEPERNHPVKTATLTPVTQSNFYTPAPPKPYPNDLQRDRKEVTLKEMGFAPVDQVNWDTIKLPAKTNLLDMLQNRITQRLNTDCTVKIGSKEFKCHKLVLQSYSNYFATHELESRIELPENKVTSKAFHLIYSWMTEIPNNCLQLLQRSNILDVFSTAQYLQIKELEEQCLAFVDSEDLFNEDTAFLLYSDAKKKKNVSIMELMVPRIQRFFLTLVSSKDWLELSLEEVIVFLHSNFICVHSEMEIFMSGIRWLMANFKERKNHIVRIMECVRFGNMSPLQLVEIRRNQDSPEIIEVVKEGAVQKMIEDGLSYSVFKDQYKDDAAAYKKLISSLRLEEPEPRNWAGQDQSYKSYKDFLDVLDSFKKAGTDDMFEWSVGSEEFLTDV
ncbi:hypothetical protein M8J76_013753 [Diaphorina citri]|nr:hypothetical protein M8J75_003794 [Diaphorina citri]KAI5733605.1 hypothetical protein M8J76_013753 [Diaphorina citri]